MVSFKRSSLALLAVVLLLVGALPALAQEQTAVIQGTVMDAQGAALPGVTVEAANERGQKYSVVSDSSGNYRFPSVPPGVYTVTGTLSGMEPASVKNLRLTLGASPKVDLTLRVGAVSEQITVTADAPLVDVTSNAAATSIAAETFEKLPRGRDFASVVTQAASANQSNKAGGITIDGASGAENRFIMDGVDTTNPKEGTQGKVLITDFVEEVQVKSAGYSAEFGGAMGGVINAITKTGTNEFAGSVVGYYNDRSWGGSPRPILQITGGAPELFEPREDDETIVDPGFTLGGPILRGRLWFYGGYEPEIRSTTRTVTFTSDNATRSYDQDFRRENYVGNLSGNIGSKFLYKATYNNSGYTTENLLPLETGRTGNASSDFSSDDELESWTLSGYADYIASPQWFFSARGGRFLRNYSTSPTSTLPRVWFEVGEPSLFPEVPAGLLQDNGFQNIPTNSFTKEDKFTRDNLNADVSWFPQLAGSHSIKAGVQLDTIKNDVLSGGQNYLVRLAWDDVCGFCTTRGTYGSAGVSIFQTSGNVKSENTGFFIQDSWRTYNDRLTLNLGVRTEQEKIPAYNVDTGRPITGEHAIKFDYADKIAPRIGFSYDLFGSGRSKVFGSYGIYYDIVKLEMPRALFGGDKWLWHNFTLDSFDWTKWRDGGCTNVTNDFRVQPTCEGMTYVNTIDLRSPSNTIENPLVDPDLKPMENQELSLGFQQELSSSLAVGFRYVNKQLKRAIEDVGVLVVRDDGSSAEEYFAANPGEGVAQKILSPDCPSCPAMPKAKRDYQGFELELTKRFGNRWSAHASYLYSKLEGNYSGLANSDETGTTGFARTAPNYNRIFDSLFMLFDQNGQAIEGPLGGDTPHSFKAQVMYSFDFGTTVGMNQYFYSGTPTTTEMRFQGAPIFPYGRNDMGRTPNITQTDLNLTHQFAIGRYGMQVGAIVLNVFDEDKATAIYPLWSASSIILRDPATGLPYGHEFETGTAEFNAAQAAAYFAGFNADTQRVANRDARYGEPMRFQDPREVRVFAKFTF